MTKTSVILSIFVFQALFYAQAFTTTTPVKGKVLSPPLSMVKYDGSRWIPTKPEEGPQAGYGIGKTLLLRGPKPFLARLLSPDDYEQAVLKFMAGDKCSRIEAQANMDFYLENPNDWAYNRFQEQKLGIKYDYASIDTKQITLTLTWATLILSLGGRALLCYQTGENFWSFLH